MYAAASTDRGEPAGQWIASAARGVLPPWAAVSEPRRAHIARVAALMDHWAERLELPAPERARWRAAGWLHDALRDAEPRQLRVAIPPRFAAWPDALLHGPAAAEQLAAAGDAELCETIRYHTTGHPELGQLGRALYLADFLEPGRGFLSEWRAGLRERLPGELDAVLVAVIESRIRHLLQARKPICAETASFWNSLVARPT